MKKFIIKTNQRFDEVTAPYGILSVMFVGIIILGLGILNIINTFVYGALIIIIMVWRISYKIMANK